MKTLKYLVIVSILTIISFGFINDSNAIPKVRISFPNQTIALSNPGPNNIWVKGHYKLNKWGKCVWVPGHWKRV